MQLHSEDDTPDWADVSNVPIETTGTLTGDVAAVLEWLTEMRDTCAAGEMDSSPRWAVVPNDPMGALRVCAAHVEAIFSRLRLQGFVTPKLSFWTDPTGFLEEATAFLGKIICAVLDDASTEVH
jgi:hypothetical protein